jgi:hypothetical protein
MSEPDTAPTMSNANDNRKPRAIVGQLKKLQTRLRGFSKRGPVSRSLHALEIMTGDNQEILEMGQDISLALREDRQMLQNSQALVQGKSTIGGVTWGVVLQAFWAWITS